MASVPPTPPAEPTSDDPTAEAGPLVITITYDRESEELGIESGGAPPTQLAGIMSRANAMAVQAVERTIAARAAQARQLRPKIALPH